MWVGGGCWQEHDSPPYLTLGGAADPLTFDWEEVKAAVAAAATTMGRGGGVRCLKTEATFSCRAREPSRCKEDPGSSRRLVFAHFPCLWGPCDMSQVRPKFLQAAVPDGLGHAKSTRGKKNKERGVETPEQNGKDLRVG